MRSRQCQPGVRNVFVRNIAARGRTATFVLRLASAEGAAVTGTVEIRNGPLPFFVAAKRQVLPLVDGMAVKRGFFDASFELAVTSDVEAQITLE
jgi:hypothetical protein